MPLSAVTSESRATAVNTGGRVVALGLERAREAADGAPDAPQGAHGHAGHDHAGHDHASHARTGAQTHDIARPPVRLGPSVLRLSLGGRLAIAGTLIAVLWAVVALVTGGAA